MVRSCHYSSATGRATLAHICTFEVRREGNPVNPYHYLAKSTLVEPARPDLPLLKLLSRDVFAAVLPQAAIPGAVIPGVCYAATTGKGHSIPLRRFPRRYADPSTEFPVFRPSQLILNTPALCRRTMREPFSRKGNFLLYSCDAFPGSILQAYRLDLKTGQARLLTDAENFNSACFYPAGG